MPRRVPHRARGVPPRVAVMSRTCAHTGVRLATYPSAGRTFDGPRPRRLDSAAMRYLGVDLGRARIGLALADDVLRTARPLSTLAHRSEAADVAAIGEVAREYEVTTAVVGLPLNMDGSEGPSARHARAFAERLSGTLGLPVELFDERLSSFEAASRLRDLGFSAKESKGRVDAEAAAVILQGWLDRREG